MMGVGGVWAGPGSAGGGFFGRSFAALLGAAGCTAFDTPEDYNRHRLSDITIPREGGDLFYFDVTRHRRISG